MKKFFSILFLTILLTFLFYCNQKSLTETSNPLHDYEQKYLSILGDSISTFEGWIPSANRVYYDGYNCDVEAVDDTWWMKLIHALDMELCVNNSWSNSRVTNTDSWKSAGCTIRCRQLHKEAITPDVIIVYMGINDFNNNVPLGCYDGTGSLPTSTKSFREAYAIMLDSLMSHYETSEIWVCTLPYSNAADTQLLDATCNKNGNSLTDYNDAILELADAFGVNVIDFANCGITAQNMHLYLGDYNHTTRRALHPNKYGHSLLANSAISALAPNYKSTYTAEPLP